MTGGEEEGEGGEEKEKTKDRSVPDGSDKHKESQRINRSIKIKWKSQRKTMRQSIRGTQVHFQEMFF